MFKYVLVPATGDEVDGPVFATALAVARPANAHLEFLHVRVDIQQTLVSIASADMGGGAAYDEIISAIEQDSAARQQKAEQAVRAFCAQQQVMLTDAHGTAGVTAMWRTEIGDEPFRLTDAGRIADLVVLGRARDDEPVALDVLETCLMGTGRPVLLAPSKPPATIGRRVAIAWKDTREAARAVDAARPFIDAADSVVIITIEEASSTPDPSAERLCAALQWRNGKTTLRRFQPGDRPAADAMLDAASSVGADLLVMGGYSHSRVREMVLGGFTRHVLQGAALPVLMAH
jgi:nucleotide-binding universal stress UspA family protein